MADLQRAVVPFRRRCKICSLSPGLPGYQDVCEAVREAARNGDPILPLHRELEERYLRFWPERSRFGYDSLHHHIGRHLGLDDLPARVEVRREAARWAADLEALRAEHAHGVGLLQALGQVAVDRMAAEALELTGADIVRLFGLMRRVEQEQAKERADVDLAAGYRRALELLADVVGRLGTERLRLEVRAELRRLEERGRPGAMIAREAARRWNDIRPAEDELEDGLSVVG